MVIEEIKPQSFLWAGNIGFYTSLNTFQSFTSMQLKGWSEENSGWMEQEGVHRDEITQFMPLWAGIPALDAVDSLLDTRVLDRFLGSEGLTFTPSTSGKSARKVPGFLAAMIIEGLQRYGKTREARSVYERHFLNPISSCNPGSIRNLLPVNLYLKILGVHRITKNEIILTHFLNNPESITVQYGKVRLLLEQDAVEIDLGSSGQFTINSPGPHRILLA